MEPLYQTEITCSCCSSVYKTSRVRSSFKRALRSDTDFCAYFDQVNPDFYVVRVCPFCGFAATENFREHLPQPLIQAYLDKIGKLWTMRDYGGERSAQDAMECYKLALLTAQTVKEKDRIVAGLLHHIAWLYRYEGNTAMENKFLGFALDAYIQVYQSERGAVNNARLLYLIGELHRRLDQPHEAVRWFSRVIHDKSITDASMIRASREQWTEIRERMTRGGLELPAEMRLSGA